MAAKLSKQEQDELAALNGGAVSSDDQRELDALNAGTEPGKIKPDRIMSGVKTLTHGGMAGFSDEVKGVDDAALHVIKKAVGGSIPSWSDIKKAYVTGRDQRRAEIDEAREAYPVQSMVTEIVGGVAVPVPGLGVAKGAATVAKATGLGAKAIKVAKSLAPATAQGALAGVGYQESADGEIASTSDIVKAGATGAAFGAGGQAVFKGGAAGLKAGGRALLRSGSSAVGRVAAEKIPREELKVIILDQIARAEPGIAATSTAKKKLGRAGEAILDDVIKSPDGDELMQVIRSDSAAKGIAKLQPMINKLGRENDRSYQLFEQSGRSSVTKRGFESRYLSRIGEASKEARREADSKMADGLEAVMERMRSEADKTLEAGGKLDLKWLRGHTTTMQSAAASKIGGLNEHETARYARLVSQRAKMILDDVIDDAAKGNPKLQAAAKSIRENNRKLYSRLSIEDTLANRAIKEDVSKPALERIGDRVSQVGALGAGLGGVGAVTALASGNEEAAESMLVKGLMAGAGAVALKGAPHVARAASRGLAASAIKELREAAQGGVKPKGSEKPMDVIKRLARDMNIPERQLRAAYIRLTVGQ